LSEWIGKRLSYANVTATVALIVALGGTSYAALILPRDSVGPRQLRAGAVRSREVKNRSLNLGDLNKTAVGFLRGQQGVAGPAGPPGPAGAAAIEYFAAMKANGDRVAGNSTFGGSGQAIGTFKVGFPRSVAGCAYTATLGTTDTATTPPGRITVGANSDGSVAVYTYDAAGSPADLPFHVLVAC
jgi:hypothetical protein